VLVLVAGAFLFVGVLRSTLTETARDQAEQDASAIATQLSEGSSAQVVVDGDDDERFFEARTRDGELLAASENAPDAGFASRGDAPSDVPETIRFDDTSFAVAHDDEGDVEVVAGRSLEGVDDAVGAVSRLLAMSVPVLGALIAALCWIVVGRALRPVERLRREVDAVGPASLSHRVADDGGSDEIGRLAGTMNRMLDRLDRSQRAQRQFVSDASHELKSPLASLRQYAEVARRYPDRLGAEELSVAVLDEGARLEAIVQNMLVLATVDERTLDPHPVDLDDLVLAEAGRLRGSTSLDIDTRDVAAFRVMGDEGLLAQLVRNLADNAARHASARIALRLGDGRLAVDDDGAGIPPEHRERVFERFVRLDEARDRDSGGSGLGLAIVRAIAEAHGGTVTIADSPLGGARVEVRLPEERPGS
jgi:signal transduction histidine kinase